MNPATERTESPNHPRPTSEDTTTATTAVEPADLTSVGRGSLARVVLPVGLGLVILGAAGCDTPGTTVQAVNRNGTVTVLGTDGDDAVTMHLEPNNPDVLQIDVGLDGSVEFAFDRDDFTNIVVRGFGGDDLLVADHTHRAFTDTEVTTMLGGGGDDVIVGSVGDEGLDGGPGADVVNGRQGLDSIVGGDGNDTFPWAPGDGNDVVLGGGGSDRSTVAGSVADEDFALVEDDGHAILTRDVGSVSLDFDQVELLDVLPSGGADDIEVADLTGTDLVTTTADFANAGGVGDDGAVDRLAVRAGVDLGQDGQVATIDGLGAQIRVVNGAGADQVQLTGTAAHDTQLLAGTDGPEVVSVMANGADVAVSGLTGSVFANLSGVEALDVDLYGGDDQFSSVGNVAALAALDVDGGQGADRLLGSNGADLLRGGPGADFIDGQQGSDLAIGDVGADTFQWDPGDGSEPLVGGPGDDRLVFHGSSIDELYEVSRDGDVARFTRNIANIVLSLDEIEALDVRALGGADQLRANDVTGTDLATVTSDFAATIGGTGDDGATDRLVVARGAALGADGVVGIAGADGSLGARYRVVNNSGADQINVVGTGDAQAQPIVGTAGADTVNVTANGADVAVMGVTGQVLTNLTAIHALDVDLGDGADTFTSTGNVAAITVLDVDGGAGADNILGSNGGDVLRGGAGADFVDGQQGTDEVFGDDGDDRFQWDPGDGTDFVEGGAGTDELQFNGSAIEESFEVSNIGGNVRFTRNIANIEMGMHGVEELDVRALGGADLLRVHDVHGTDLETVTADFASTIGGAGDDGQIDRVMVPSGVVAQFAGGTPVVDGLGAQIRVVNPGSTTTDWIHVAGTGGFDTQGIYGTAGADNVQVTANGADVAVFGVTGPMLLNLSAVGVLDVGLGDGDDHFSAVGNLAALTVIDVDGEQGNDTILGGNGGDFLAGGPGNDFIDGQQGVDDIEGNDGDDTFQWDPGDGSDVLVGGAGIDTMRFNGSAGNEIFELSAHPGNAGHVRFTRNLAAINLDIDDVEAFDLRALGGTDTLTVQDLTGTDMTEVMADLAGTIGGSTADGSFDQVIVNGTTGDDTIAVVDDGEHAVVTGLSALVAVKSADPAFDQLVVNGLEGNDTVEATPGAAALIQLFPQP